MTIGDLVGDSDPEVLAEPGHGWDPAVFNLAGTRLVLPQIDGYVAQLAAADSDGDGKDEAIIYTYPHGDHQSRFHVIDLRSGERWQWDVKPAGFEILDEGRGAPTVVLATDQGFELRTLRES